MPGISSSPEPVPLGMVCPQPAPTTPTTIPRPGSSAGSQAGMHQGSESCWRQPSRAGHTYKEEQVEEEEEVFGDFDAG